MVAHKYEWISSKASLSSIVTIDVYHRFRFCTLAINKSNSSYHLSHLEVFKTQSSRVLLKLNYCTSKTILFVIREVLALNMSVVCGKDPLHPGLLCKSPIPISIDPYQ